MCGDMKILFSCSLPSEKKKCSKLSKVKIKNKRARYAIVFLKAAILLIEILMIFDTTKCLHSRHVHSQVQWTKILSPFRRPSLMEWQSRTKVWTLFFEISFLKVLVCAWNMLERSCNILSLILGPQRIERRLSRKNLSFLTRKLELIVPSIKSYPSGYFQDEDYLMTRIIELLQQCGEILEIGLHHVIDGGCFTGKRFVTLNKAKNKEYKDLRLHEITW